MKKAYLHNSHLSEFQLDSFYCVENPPSALSYPSFEESLKIQGFVNIFRCLLYIINNFIYIHIIIYV